MERVLEVSRSTPAVPEALRAMAPQHSVLAERDAATNPARTVISCHDVHKLYLAGARSVYALKAVDLQVR